MPNGQVEITIGKRFVAKRRVSGLREKIGRQDAKYAKTDAKEKRV
jgi:hypothetical protein